jgi:hypothetical protein
MAALPVKVAPLQATREAIGTIAELDRAIAAKKDLLKKQDDLRRGHQERCDKFLVENDESSFVKETFKKERLILTIKTLQDEIDALEAERPQIVEREAEQRDVAERKAIEAEIREFLPFLKKAEEKIEWWCDFASREAAISAKISRFNQRKLSPGVAPIEHPEVALRHLPGVPARQNGTRKVTRSRISGGGAGKSVGTHGGPGRYENYEADEPVIIPAIPEFKPAPLYLRIIVPSFHRDGPRYSPPGYSLPW